MSEHQELLAQMCTPEWWEQDDARADVQLDPYRQIDPATLTPETALQVAIVALQEIIHLRSLLRAQLLAEAPPNSVAKPRGRPRKTV